MKMPKTAKSVRPGMKPYWPELENKLHECVLDKQMNGIGNSGTMIRLLYTQKGEIFIIYYMGHHICNMMSYFVSGLYRLRVK